MRRVGSFDIFQILYPILTDNPKQTLLTPLFIFLLRLVSPIIIRKNLRYYRCSHFIHSIIRGCEIVLVSINRLIYLMNNI